ncbi:uncharacterized protein AMSG_01959 [Thecamonas trahens ATCC 50062]|uniref:Peptidase M12B domain-containing protein n=1 Tax=Thecamonas trahens ATCC 50062 TaxID=461836 RepID=A0A0L0DTW1_THETB|nr:hypothetical protein AMSG_01959 [Thecamonas trahens ATCC 50062]KNC55690.1 hypothetical protein AMSG_01959 [Thecamonas trahens ATCC 50062]|eukprot:XP_013761457.1 hypothetical protein AMSG_01959 [Thecamonas trahens ATCC 50062]
MANVVVLVAFVVCLSITIQAVRIDHGLVMGSNPFRTSFAVELVAKDGSVVARTTARYAGDAHVAADGATGAWEVEPRELAGLQPNVAYAYTATEQRKMRSDAGLAHDSSFERAVYTGEYVATGLAGDDRGNVRPLLSKATVPALAFDEASPIDDEVVRREAVFVDPELAESLAPGIEFEMAVHEEIFRVQVTSTSRRLHNALAVSATLLCAAKDAMAHQACGTATLVVHRHVVVANLVHEAHKDPSAPLEHYQLRYHGSGENDPDPMHKVRTIDQQRFPDEESVLPPADAAMADDESSDAANRLASDDTTAGGVPILDVFVAYTTAMKNGRGGTSAAEAHILLGETESNEIYQNSGVNMHMRIVYTKEYAYTELSSGSNMLTDFRNNNGVFSDVTSIRAMYGADIGSLWTQTHGGSCGVGYVATSMNQSPVYAVAVCKQSCAVGYYTFAHEHGHNMGCNHDLANDGVKLHPYSLGHHWSGNAYRSAMAYSPGTRVKHHSSPLRTHNGQPTGVADVSDNARSLNNAISMTTNWYPDTIDWSVGTYGACSVSCGGGVATRPVTCQLASGTVIDDALCEIEAAKPSTSQACNTQSCATYSWQTGSFGACSVACGGGSQSRSVDCVESATGTIVAETNCDAGSKPATSQSCNSQVCVTYSWVAGSWGSCSVACGGGSQSRTVECESSTGSTVADANCDAGTQPAATQICNTQACPTYAWVTSGWTTCSEPCGPEGLQTRTATCYRDGSAVVADTFCTDPMPALQQTCNTGLCAQSTRGWPVRGVRARRRARSWGKRHESSSARTWR